jgi:hypothetical protein
MSGFLDVHMFLQGIGSFLDVGYSSEWSQAAFGDSTITQPNGTNSIAKPAKSAFLISEKQAHFPPILS